MAEQTPSPDTGEGGGTVGRVCPFCNAVLAHQTRSGIRYHLNHCPFKLGESPFAGGLTHGDSPSQPHSGEQNAIVQAGDGSGRLSCAPLNSQQVHQCTLCCMLLQDNLLLLYSTPPPCAFLLPLYLTLPNKVSWYFDCLCRLRAVQYRSSAWRRCC